MGDLGKVEARDLGTQRPVKGAHDFSRVETVGQVLEPVEWPGRPVRVDYPLPIRVVPSGGADKGSRGRCHELAYSLFVRLQCNAGRSGKSREKNSAGSGNPGFAQDRIYIQIPVTTAGALTYRSDPAPASFARLDRSKGIVVPSYVELLNSGDLRRRVSVLDDRLDACDLCPWRCGVNRRAGETKVCQGGYLPQVSSWAPHFGEEPALSGTHLGKGEAKGAGNVFLGRCNLRCVYCQNWQISQPGASQERARGWSSSGWPRFCWSCRRRAVTISASSRPPTS